jgi:hypothetical protein
MQRHLPPKVPNRSATSNEMAKDGAVPSSYLKSYNKNVPSTTKASTVMSETPKSTMSGPVGKSKPTKKNVLNTSHNSSEGGKEDPGLSRALLLYETQTVASKHKREEKYKPEEALPAWGIQAVNTNSVGKRTTSATTRTTVTPRATQLKRGHTST